MNNPTERAIASAFQLAFIRALEQWTFELRLTNDDRRYAVAAGRNNYVAASLHPNLLWSKPNYENTNRH